MTCLLVVAHPDDEALGAGGMACGLADRGEQVHSCILSGSVDARRHRPEVADLHTDMLAAHTILGLAEPIVGPFPNIAFNTVPHVELVQFIEAAIESTGATTIVTHHPSDLNNDHHHVSLACQAAARLFQRRPGIPPLARLLFMEILSSTDWSFPGGSIGFEPTAFMELGPALLDRKLEALRAYRGVMRDYPHPRSEESVRSLAAYRGGQAGVVYAEAFQVAFQRLKP